MLLTDKRICFALLLVINTAIFILCANIFPIRFLTNDDVSMVWIANGVMTGTPDCHLVFMNALYGCFLNFLYGIVPNVEWYSVCFSVFHVVAISIIVAFFYNKIENKLIRWTVIVLYYLLWFRIIQFFQFTTTTAMLTFAAVLLLLDRLYIIGGGILLISSLLRFEAMGMVGLLSIPLFLYYYRFDLKKYVPVVLVLFVVCGLHMVDKLFYQSPEWKEYCEYNHYRSVVNDSPNNWILNQVELPPNVSQENLQLLRNCNADPCQISDEDMKKLAESINKTPFLLKCHNLPYTIMHYPFHKLYLGIFVLMFLLFLLSVDTKERKFFVVLSFLFFMLVLWYISLNGNIKLRILESVCFVLFSYVLLLNFNQESVYITKKSFIAILPLVMVCGILFIHERACLKTKNNSNKEEQLWVINETDGLQILNINHEFTSEQLSPFFLHKFPHQKFIPGGWLTKSPFVPIKSFSETIDSNIGFFVSKNDSLTSFRNALKNNYGIETELQTIVESEHYAVVALKSRPVAERKN